LHVRKICITIASVASVTLSVSATVWAYGAVSSRVCVTMVAVLSFCGGCWVCGCLDSCVLRSYVPTYFNSRFRP